jgi:hypothetical protein
MWLSYPLSYGSIGSSASYTILTNPFISLLSSRTTSNIRSVTPSPFSLSSSLKIPPIFNLITFLIYWRYTYFNQHTRVLLYCNTYAVLVSRWLMFSNIVSIIHIHVSRKLHTFYTWYVKQIATNTRATLRETKSYYSRYL